MIKLPFSEDKRKLEDKYLALKNSVEKIKAKDFQIKVAENFVSRLTTKYTPYNFSNPGKLYFFWIFTEYLKFCKSNKETLSIISLKNLFLKELI